MAGLMSTKLFNESEAEITLQKLLSGAAVEREYLIRMGMYLSEDRRVGMWWAEALFPGTTTLPRLGNIQHEQGDDQFPYRAWMRSLSLSAPWSR